jgi:uncharacterized damage-inducible protein DinB
MSQLDVLADPRDRIVSQIEQAARLLLVDLKHIPEEKRSISPGGVARTPYAILAECIGVNDMIADVLAGKPRTYPSKEEQEAFAARFQSIETVEEGLRQSVAKLRDVVNGFETVHLEEEVAAPWGMTYPKGALALFAATHMMYHDGQLNYIQALNGDPDVHWGEEA